MLFFLPWLVEALRCRKQIDRNLKELLRVQQLHGLFGQYQKQGWRKWTGETREESGHDQKTVSSLQPYWAVCFLVTSWEEGAECEMVITCDLGCQGVWRLPVYENCWHKVWELCRASGMSRLTWSQRAALKVELFMGGCLFSLVTWGCCFLFTQALSPISLHLNMTFPDFQICCFPRGMSIPGM